MTENSITTTTEYLAGGFQYKGAYLQFFPHAEGYVNVVDSNGINNYNYVFNYTDHLGNIRVSYGLDPETQSLKILEENHYYAFGLKHTNYNSDINLYIRKSSGSLALKKPAPSTPVEPAYQYKYNGKELQTELGLNMYDMDMRDYDPAIARWVAQDPVIHYDYSPYNAFDNNPVIFADPSGADAYEDKDGYHFTGADAQNFFAQLQSQLGSSDGGETNDDYFDKKTGKFLGRGGTDEIRFIDEKDYKAGKLDNYTTSGKTITNEAAKAVVLYYAKFTDKKITNPFTVSINNNYKQVTSFDPQTGLITYHFHKPGLGDFIINRYDLINMWEHEGFKHGEDHIKLWNTEKRKYNYDDDYYNFEVSGVTHQIKTSSWNKTSVTFKEYISYHYGKKLLPPSVYYKYFKQIIKQ